MMLPPRCLFGGGAAAAFVPITVTPLRREISGGRQDAGIEEGAGPTGPAPSKVSD